jgi:SAM-dependent methyltransferase
VFFSCRFLARLELTWERTGGGVRAPHRGAAVTGLGLTPELLAVAQGRAAEEGYGDITWMDEDAEDLPFADGTFAVFSSCDLMFAPDQQKAAREVAREQHRRRKPCPATCSQRSVR